MKRMLSTAITGSIMTAALLATSPAQAYDPCARAYQQEKEAENAFWRWCGNHDSTGSCSVTGRGELLYNEWQGSVRARQRACS